MSQRMATSCGVVNGYHGRNDKIQSGVTCRNSKEAVRKISRSEHLRP